MDPKHDRKPPPTAETIFNPPKTVKAKVRPNNRYGDHFAGEPVEVTEKEYDRCRHALVTVEDEKVEATKAAEAAKPPDDAGLFRAFRQSARAAQASKQRANEARRRAEFAALGFKPAG